MRGSKEKKNRIIGNVHSAIDWLNPLRDALLRGEGLVS